ncbi:hypothetical protein SAMN05216233_12832 [Desulfoluna spongiiphila]|uniref:Uncharacterized protein n=1 Tax=Desulfoluna spongiiphila TaxID=419481 RepID=A0A1G5JDK7_9BACT|nr:hypothetical protein SAMN05216233_12832 [Desulfoluna spongiiphila]
MGIRPFFVYKPINDASGGKVGGTLKPYGECMDTFVV